MVLDRFFFNIINHSSRAITPKQIRGCGLLLYHNKSTHCSYSWPWLLFHFLFIRHILDLCLFWTSEVQYMCSDCWFLPGYSALFSLYSICLSWNKTFIIKICLCNICWTGKPQQSTCIMWKCVQLLCNRKYSILLSLSSSLHMLRVTVNSQPFWTWASWPPWGLQDNFREVTRSLWKTIQYIYKQLFDTDEILSGFTCSLV